MIVQPIIRGLFLTAVFYLLYVKEFVMNVLVFWDIEMSPEDRFHCFMELLH